MSRKRQQLLINIQNKSRRILSAGAVIVDLETTGIPGEPVQIGILHTNGKILLDCMVHPATYEISEEAYSIHGISNSDVERSKTFRQLYGAIAYHINNSYMVVYNLGYDLNVLQDTCELYDLEPFNPAHTDCIMKMYAPVYGAWDYRRKTYRWQKLQNAARQIGIDQVQSHRAIDDCRLTLSLIQYMANMEIGDE